VPGRSARAVRLHPKARPGGVAPSCLGRPRPPLAVSLGIRVLAGFSGTGRPHRGGRRGL